MTDLIRELPFVEADAVGPKNGSAPPLVKNQTSFAKQPKRIVRQTGYGGKTYRVMPDEYTEALELAVLSQEPGHPLFDTFAYDEMAGQGITVYILGTGMELQSEVGSKDVISTFKSTNRPCA